MGTLTEKRNLLQEIQTAFTQRGLDSHANNKEALDLFSVKGLPGSRSEEYKFTPITWLLEKVLDLSPADISPKSQVQSAIPIIGNLNCNVVAFVNGVFSRERSIILDEDVNIRVVEAAKPKAESDPFDLLNQAFSNSVVQMDITPKKSIKHPVAVVYYFDSTKFVFANPRWRCQVGTQSNVSIIEYISSTEKSTYFNNKHSLIEVGENAQLEYTSIQNGPVTDIQVSNTAIHLAAAAKASCFTFTFDGQFIRNTLNLSIEGQGVDAHLYGLYLLSRNTLADNHTVVDHKMPNSYSNELYKGVMDGNSKGVFNGKIYVRPQAQKTNAFQSNRNILLSESATVNTKPQLEIWADDVKCSHGCTTGQLDEEALFYLRTRGISKDMARGMLLHAFAAETTAALKNETVKNFIEGLISDKLQKSF